MYSSRGTNAYGQQSYGGQSGYAQNLGAGYSGSSIGGPDGGAQMSLSSRHSSILGNSQEAEVGGYRALPSVSAHYGGQYSSIYGTAALTVTQQVPAISSKGAGASALEARSAYTSAVPDSPKFASTDYVSSLSHGYSRKGDQIYAEKIPDYPTVERRQGGYLGRELPSEPTGRYANSAIFGHQHQPEIYDRLDQAALLRQEQLLKVQSASLDGSSRQADYLAARSAASRHSTQDRMPYEGRIDADPRSLSLLSSSSYGGQPPSILGAAPGRNVDDLMYPPNSANPGYGVSLPPGRDYGTKGLHVTSLESEYPGSTLSRSGDPRIDERKDDRAGYLREFELREEVRRREHLREREKDRERERERLRERGRERDRLRILERREKVRERERKRALEVTHERTPPRVSRDHRGPSLTKEARPVRRDSPRHEASHRRLSPVKEKRREYVCKVYSSTLVDVERDYLSIDKRYPRLFVSPEFSKVVINWPKENLKLSMHTPVSFEHDFIQEDNLAVSKELSSKLLPVEPEKFEQGSTVWNAKMILMSGLSRSALEELPSEKVPDDRIPHICNILRFAVLKKDHSFMAIGGPWVSAADGCNPTDDKSSLIQTALRYAKDVVSLDLQNCQHWNRFLEIHYDRVGKDGLFSHKEVTVLFVPDLSECLPSFDTWRAQWLAHRKAVSERERQLSVKREKSKERKEGSKDKEADSAKHTERGKSEKKSQSVSSSHGVVANRKKKDSNCIEGDAAEGKVSGGENKFEVKDGSEITVGGGPEKKESGEAAADKTGAVKSLKKKVIKRIVKQKVANKTAAEVNTASKQSDKVDEDVGEQNAKSEIASQQEESSAGRAGVKTFVRKKITKKVAVEKTDQSEDNGVPIEAKVEIETGCSEDKPKDNSDVNAAAVENASVKTTVKKKVIKRVPKRKVTATQAKDEVAEIMKAGDKDEKEVVQAGSETSNIGKQTGSEKQGNAASSSKLEMKADKENKKDEKVTNVESLNDKQKINTKDNRDVKGGKLKEGEKPKDEKEEKDSKDESRGNHNKESKEKRKSEEPPVRHPGLILQTKWSKDCKLRSLSLSLDSLLDYTDKDIEESTFELSLFAEALYEMLQYQMGCCILTFLQKLRVRFMRKRNQRKRQREEIREKEAENKSPTKRLKGIELPVKNESTKSDTSSAAQQVLQEDEMFETKEETTADYVEEPKIKDEIDDEDPEEDPEEYEEMDDAVPQPNYSNEKNEEEKTDTDAKPEKEAEKDEAGGSPKEKTTTKAASTEPGPEGDMSAKREPKVDPKKEHAINKDLLQVEDMRLIIHNLGKFLSHRDVKELVQSALFESNTGRDDHILYNKLVRLPGI
ncbi:hypothetical protein CRYUN_Cryun29cG0098000 [Craigia yunnanensis]